MRGLARWSARHAAIVAVLWVLAIVGVQIAAASAGSDFRNSFALPGTGSQSAVDVLHKHFPEAAGDADTIVFRSDSGPVSDDAVRARAQSLLADVAAVPSVVAVRSPFGPQGNAQISADGTVAYATVQYATAGVEVPRADLEAIVAVVKAADHGAFHVAIGGQGVAALEHPQIGIAELIGIAFAAIVLLLVFRSRVAMFVPIVSAGAGLGVATGAVRLLSHATTISDVAPSLGLLLGLGVGIDYALFIVGRHQALLKSGRGIEESIAAALDTSGRAVVFAGATVVIALAGLFVPGIEFLYGIAIAAAISVILTVFAAITLLPAILRAIGMRVLGRRAREQLAGGIMVDDAVSGGFQRWAGLVKRRPVALVLLGLVGLAVVAIPAMDLRLGTADQGNDPAGTTTRQAYDMLADAFGPGVNGPLVVAVDMTASAPGTPIPQALAPLAQELQRDPAVASIRGPVPSSDGKAAVIRVIPKTSPQDQATSDLINKIRDDIAPPFEAKTGAKVWVGGPTATFDDFATAIQDKLPLFLTVIIGLSLILLVIAFRSLLIPLLGAVLNLVSVAAAFGVVVAVFQWGWAAGLIGLGKEGPIEPFLPVVLFAMLFGLSMDYQVFLVSRMREEWARRSDNSAAVRIGHAASGRIIVAAGTIMVFVFGSFVFGDSRTIKLLGLGMAAAILLDAFIIRMLIVPALMHVMGRANWWIPRWLDAALPRLAIEGHPFSDDDAATRAQRPRQLRLAGAPGIAHAAHRADGPETHLPAGGPETQLAADGHAAGARVVGVDGPSGHSGSAGVDTSGVGTAGVDTVAVDTATVADVVIDVHEPSDVHARTAVHEPSDGHAPCDAHEPSDHLGRTLRLMEQIDDAGRALAPLLDTVREISGLTGREAGALTRLAGGNPHGVTHRDASALAAKGLLKLAEADTGGAPANARWALTPAGEHASAHLEALRARLITAASEAGGRPGQ